MGGGFEGHLFVAAGKYFVGRRPRQPPSHSSPLPRSQQSAVLRTRFALPSRAAPTHMGTELCSSAFMDVMSIPQKKRFTGSHASAVPGARARSAFAVAMWLGL